MQYCWIYKIIRSTNFINKKDLSLNFTFSVNEGTDAAKGTIRGKILDDIEPTNIAAAGRMRKRSKFASIFRYALRLSSVSWKFTTTVSWLTVAWKRAKFAACRKETLATADVVRPIRGVVPHVLAWRAAKIKKKKPKKNEKKAEKKSTSADPRQYANTAIKRALSFSFYPPSLPPAPSRASSFYLVRRRYINRRTMSTQKCRQMGFPPPRYVARMLSPFPNLSWNHPQCSLS